MASPRPCNLLFACLLLLLLSISQYQYSAVAAQSRPKALVIPVTKDAATSQYVTRVSQRTPLVPLDLAVDIGGRFLWVDCDAGSASSTYRPARCRSAQCSLANSNACSGNAVCGHFPYNPFSRTSTYGDLAGDVLALNSTDGSTAGGIAAVPQFLFTCAPAFLLEGLARGARGVAGLGKTRIALPSQLAAAFSFDRKFAMCLSPSSRGVIFFGDGPYLLQPDVDVSRFLTYTPLVTNPVSTAGTYVQGEPSYEYFIRVRSIEVDGKTVPLNATLLSIDRDGVGGTKISTVDPYTVLESSIYSAVTGAFAEALAERNITRVAAVAPFGACFDAGTVPGNLANPAVPTVELVLDRESVRWTMFGANSMVRVRDDVLCLAFVDGGSTPRTSVVLGGHQLEENLLQFDLATSRLGFSSLLFRGTTCAGFNDSPRTK